MRLLSVVIQNLFWVEYNIFSLFQNCSTTIFWNISPSPYLNDEGNELKSYISIFAYNLHITCSFAALELIRLKSLERKAMSFELRAHCKYYKTILTKKVSLNMKFTKLTFTFTSLKWGRGGKSHIFCGWLSENWRKKWKGTRFTLSMRF